MARARALAIDTSQATGRAPSATAAAAVMCHRPSPSHGVTRDPDRQ